MKLDQKDLSQEEVALFVDLAEVLARHAEVGKRFAVARIHQHFPIAPDEVLYETSDASARESIVRPRRKLDVPPGAFASQWRLCSGGTGMSFEAQLMCCTDEPQGYVAHQLCCGDGIEK